MIMSDNRVDGERETVILYIVDIRELKPYADTLADKLCANRRRKMNAYLRADDRLRCLGGGLLMRRFLGTDDVSKNQYGKPALSPERFASRAPCHFNVSHSGNYVVLALCGAAVGVDIEEMLEVEYARLAKTCFHAGEQTLLDNAAERDRRLLFYKLWTLKESCVKAVGLGLSIAPERFEIRLDDSGSASLPACPEYRFITEVFMTNYALSVCAAAPRELAIDRRMCRASEFLDEGGWINSIVHS